MALFGSAPGEPGRDKAVASHPSAALRTSSTPYVLAKTAICNDQEFARGFIFSNLRGILIYCVTIRKMALWLLIDTIGLPYPTIGLATLVRDGRGAVGCLFRLE